MVIEATIGTTGNQKVFKDSSSGEMQATPFFVSFSFVRKEKSNEHLFPAETLDDDVNSSLSSENSKLAI